MQPTLLLLAGLALVGQPTDDARLLRAAERQAAQHQMAYAAGDYDFVADRTPPAALRSLGGKAEIARWFKKRADELHKKTQWRVMEIAVLPAREVHRVGKELIVFVPTRTRTQDADSRTVREDHLIAVSDDEGKTWTFLERGQRDETSVMDLFPAWPKALRLPLPARYVEEEFFAGAFTDARANYKVTWPAGWRRTLKTNPGEFGLQRGQEAIQIAAEANGPAPEEQLAEFLASLKNVPKSSFKEIGRANLKVGGVDARLLHAELNADDGVTDYRVAAYQFEGISYRAVSYATKGAAPEQEKHFRAILANISFLGERKEWRAQSQGQPRRTAFLGGRASIELNRPRWRETTFDNAPQPGHLESLYFNLFNNNAWLSVWATDRRSTVKAELDEVEQFYGQSAQNAVARRVAFKGPKGLLAGLEMTGTYSGEARVLFACAFVKDGLSVQLLLECRAAQRGQVQKDWEQLVRGFRFEDATTTPPLFPLRTQGSLDNREPNPALAVLLKKAAVVYPSDRVHTVHSISADGQQALLNNPDGMVVERLADRSRVPIALLRDQGPGRRLGAGALYGVSAAWSSDGKRIAVARFGNVVTFTIGEKISTEYPGAAASLAFLPDQRLLVAARPPRDDPRRFPPADDILPPGLDEDDAPRAGSRFLQQKLLICDDPDDDPRTLLDFPLARFAHLAVSPDGKRLALVTNKDGARTAARPGNVYVCKIDGTGLRQLTKGPELIGSVAWSEDGRFLYVVRRPIPERSPELFLPGDLYRITVETGAMENLTRCGKIERAWVQGDHLLLKITTGDVPAAQRGIFKVAAADLADAAARLPERGLGNAKAQARKIGGRVEAAFAPARLRDVVPTAEVMAKLARAFAEAAAEEFGEPFDYSAASLDALPRQAAALQPALASEPGVLYGLGAYYGETLRNLAGAEWHIEPLPLGDWLPGGGYHANAILQVVLPFSEIARGNDGDAARVFYLIPSSSARNKDRARFLLVYPTAAAERALHQATPKDFHLAFEHLDRGEMKAGLALLARVVRAHPQNTALALDALDLCEVAGLRPLADDMARTAVDAGSAVPNWLLRRADALAKNDPKQAIALYRKAAQAPYAPAETYLKLGRLLAASDQQPLADACFRRAYQVGSNAQRAQARRLLSGAPAAKGEKSSAP